MSEHNRKIVGLIADYVESLAHPGTTPDFASTVSHAAAAIRGMPPTALPEPSDLYEDVGRFHARFDLPRFRAGVGTPATMSRAVAKFRLEFLHEELVELEAAVAEGDLPGQVDALADLVWVALGTAHYLDVDFLAHWAEVRRANMEKERPRGPDDPRLHGRARGKRAGVPALDIVKPEGWRPPDHEAVLRMRGWLL